MKILKIGLLFIISLVLLALCMFSGSIIVSWLFYSVTRIDLTNYNGVIPISVVMFFYGVLNGFVCFGLWLFGLFYFIELFKVSQSDRSNDLLFAIISTITNITNIVFYLLKYSEIYLFSLLFSFICIILVWTWFYINRKDKQQQN